MRATARNYVYVTTPEGGIPHGATVECSAVDLVSGRLVQRSVPVYGLPLGGHPGNIRALAAHIGGRWVITSEGEPDAKAA